MKDTKEALINQIIAIELKMFLAVPAAYKSPCQRDPDTFCRNRWSQFYPWSETTLISYLNDLKTYREKNENPLFIKYGLMDNSIAKKNTNPIIKEMVRIQYQWQEEMASSYPNIMNRARPLQTAADTERKTSFETYLGCELETYSDRTLNLLYQDILDKEANHINLSEEIYTYLVKDLGYNSLDDAEKQHASPSQCQNQSQSQRESL